MITIGAMSEEHASILREALENAAFVEVDVRGAA